MDNSIQMILSYFKQKKGFNLSGYSKNLIAKQNAQNLTTLDFLFGANFFNIFKNNPARFAFLLDNLIINE